MLHGQRLILLQCCIILYLDYALQSDTSPSTFADLTFVAEPHDVMTSRDKSVTLDCSLVVGIKKLQLDHTWFRNEQQLVLNSRRKLLGNGSLVMDGRLDEGIFYCMVTIDGLGAIVSKKAEIRLIPPDKWNSGDVRETSEIRAYTGDTVMLPCRNISFISSPPHRSSVVWLKGDVEMDLSGTNHLLHHNEGGLLEITSVQFSDFGSYQCRSSGGNGEWWNDVVLIQNTDTSSYQGVVPKFVARPRDVVGVEGGLVVLPCAANGRDRNGKKAKVVWLKDGITIDFSSDGHLSLVGEGSLRMDGLMEEDSGEYTCRASNLEGSIDADITFNVQVPPKIRVRPRNGASTSHSDYQLSCDIYANPPPQVTWFKNGVPLVLDEYVEIVDGHSLRILGIEPSDSGIYQCIADNPAGNLQAAAFLFVNHDNTTHQRSIGELPVPSSLTSSITFMRSVTLSWRLPDSAANFEDVVGYLVSWEEEGEESRNGSNARRRRRTMNVTSLEANVQFLKPSTKYRVDIVSYNQVGATSLPAMDYFITQDEAQVPEPPINLQAIVTSSTSIHLSWEGSTPGKTSTSSGFKIFYFDVSDGSTEKELTVSKDSHVFENLKKFSTYSFRVASFNVIGQSSSTDDITARTFSDVPSESPQNVSLETLSSTSILVRWEPPPEEFRNGIITGYRIKFKVTKDKVAPAAVVLTDGVQVFHSLTDLSKGTEYSIRVQSQTRNGTGPSSPWLQAQTLTHDLDESTVPGQPFSLRARPLTSSILISWTPPSNQEVMVRGYVVSYGIGAPHAARQILDAKQRYHTIKDLKPSSNYIITLMAYNAAGEGPPAYEAAVTREEQAYEPSVEITPPVGLKAIVLSSSTIVLTWTDTGLGKNQRVIDNRYYTVKYSPKNQQPTTKSRPKFINSTDLNLPIEDLKPDTEYEFSVRIVKGRRQSFYSLSIFNKTTEASPATAPRDVTPVSVDQKPTWVSLSWQPPRQSNGQINGYLIYYTTDSSLSDVDWVVEAIMGDRLSTTLKDLSLETTYYFKVRARNNIGYGPMSPTVIFRTPRNDGNGGGAISDEFGRGKHFAWRNRANIITTPQPMDFNVPANVLWIAIGCLSGLAFVILTIVGVVVCRKKARDKEDVHRNGYMPANKDKSMEGSLASGRSRELKPPDLWTHGRNLEMRTTERGSNGDPDELTEMMSRHASSIDDDGNSDTERYRCVNPRLKVMEGHPLREPYLISNGHLTSTMTRPNYPRTQYSGQQQMSTPRVNVGLVSPSIAGDHNTSMSSYEDKHDSISPCAPSRLPPSLPGKSPPPLNIPPIIPSSASSNSSKHYPSSNNIHHDVTSDIKSFTTEELCAEMANLEGLMKDLSAITQQEFNC